MSFPDIIDTAKEMDLLKKAVAKPEEHRLYVTEGCRSAFGESTSRGAITRNCVRSMRAMGMAIPSGERNFSDEEIIMGAEPIIQRLRRYLRRKLAAR
jgi:hypothetical protein